MTQKPTEREPQPVNDVLALLDRLAVWPADDIVGVRYHAFEMANYLRSLPPVRAEELTDLIREAFRAGFLAHPDPEAEKFTWNFGPGWMADDREESAWQAYQAAAHEPKP